MVVDRCPNCRSRVAGGAVVCPACGGLLEDPGTLHPPPDLRAYNAELRRRRQAERRSVVRRVVTFLAAAAAALTLVAVTGSAVTPVHDEGDPLHGLGFAACQACVRHLQDEMGVPASARFPNCLLEVGGFYRGGGIYDVSSSFEMPAAAGGTVVQQYSCRVQRFPDATWAVLQLRLGD